jgi:hypothetical protein
MAPHSHIVASCLRYRSAQLSIHSLLYDSKWPMSALSYCTTMRETKHTCQWAASSWTSLSRNFRPMRRLKAKTVFAELTMACCFAGKLTKRSLCFVNAMTDGVVRAPPHSHDRVAKFRTKSLFQHCFAIEATARVVQSQTGRATWWDGR